MAAICSELKLPSREGGAEIVGTSRYCCACRKDMTAGDISTFADGVNGTGDMSFLKSGLPDQLSAFWGCVVGMVSFGNAL